MLPARQDLALVELEVYHLEIGLFRGWIKMP